MMRFDPLVFRGHRDSTRRYWVVACLALVTARPVAAQIAPGLDPSGNRDAPRLMAQAVTDEKGPKSKVDLLLADDNLEEAITPTRFFGFDQVEAAYTYARPAHWSKLTNRLELGAQGAFSADLKWKVSGRFDYQGIYALSDFYPSRVRDDHRAEAMVRETYLDWDTGAIDFRFGRQQIVWGEVVGLFFADVVSAKDLREFVLPDFDLLRIPQWAARAEYFKNDIHVEGVWIPAPTMDRIGRPGSEFYPYPPAPPPGYDYVINDERKPSTFSHENFGLRASILRGGWDAAAFAYRSLDSQASFFREIVTGAHPAVIYTPRHEMITQYGSTISKDLGDFLVKSEVIYTVGRNFSTQSLADGDGLVAQNFLDYIVTFEMPLPDDARVNAQIFQRRYENHDANIIPRRIESGASLFWSGKWGNFEPQILGIHSLERTDYLIRPKLVWRFAKEWRATFGVDVFGGKSNGLFGQYDQKDRVYTDLRKSF
jgi:hypothetical protein